MNQQQSVTNLSSTALVASHFRRAKWHIILGKVPSLSINFNRTRHNIASVTARLIFQVSTPCIFFLSSRPDRRQPRNVVEISLCHQRRRFFFRRRSNVKLPPLCRGAVADQHIKSLHDIIAGGLPHATGGNRNASASLSRGQDNQNCIYYILALDKAR